jgi:type I restriction enzyme M protein
MRFEEFAACQAWWHKRSENERAWRVAAAEIAANGHNLDLLNPSRSDLAHRPPAELVAELLDAEHEILRLLSDIQQELTA